MRQQTTTPFRDISLTGHVETAIQFATILSTSCSIDLSNDAEGGFNRLVVPFMLCPEKHGDSGPAVDDFIETFNMVIFAIAQHIEPTMIFGITIDQQ